MFNIMEEDILLIGSALINRTWGTGFKVNSSTGCIYVTGTFTCTSNAMYKSGRTSGYYQQNGYGSVLYVNSLSIGNVNTKNAYQIISGTEWKSKSQTTYSKGTTQYSDVTSTNNSTYPSNGASGSYWYVYKGVY